MTSSRSVTRRGFLGASATAGAALTGQCLGRSPLRVEAAEDKAAEDRAAEDRAAPVIDCHAHLTHHSSAAYQEKDRKLIEAADRLGIDRLCCSILTPRRPATAEGFRECNAWLAEAMKRFGGRVLGYCYVNPGYGRQAVEEVRRCVEDRGFIGVKLYNEHVCTDPVVFPIVELAIKLRVPILHHAGHAHYPLPGQPRISDGGLPAKKLAGGCARRSAGRNRRPGESLPQSTIRPSQWRRLHRIPAWAKGQRSAGELLHRDIPPKCIVGQRDRPTRLAAGAGAGRIRQRHAV